MTGFNKPSSISAVSLAAALVAACGGSGGGGVQSKSARSPLGITDAPVDVADAVVVQFSGVELKPKDGSASRSLRDAKTIDLLALQGTNRATLLDGEQIPSGEYTWMRLKVNADPNVARASYITIAGSHCELESPAATRPGSS